mgnify:CR=1 FL=1
MTPAALAVDALAVYRLTRLVTADSIAEPARSHLIHAAYSVARGPAEADELDQSLTEHQFATWTDHALTDPDVPRLAELITCRWCAGWWIALAVTVARRRWPNRWAPVAEALAVAGAAALAGSLER